jgi:hypothetical protein
MLFSYPTDPEYAYCDIALLMTCAELVLVHTKEHGYSPNVIMLPDEKFQAYVAQYKVPSKAPTFLGVPVVAGKA